VTLQQRQITEDVVVMAGDISASRATGLDRILANRRWWQCDVPFRHYVATSVFTPDIYAGLVESFRASLSKQGYLAKHDIHGTTFEPGLSGPLSLFVSRDWHDLVAGLFNVRATGHISGGTHHHEPGSKDGFPHNDLNPGWFLDYDSDDGIVLPQHSLCQYTTGATTSTLPPRRVIRAVALLYYLDNPAWRQGDGGETALYASASDPIDAPLARIAPRNNTLLAFECTPYSYHAFIGNRINPRNSVIMWIHREPDEVSARWGPGVIEEFRY
jgi:2OG-Fe(II) oxygenase superfamily